MIKRLFDIFFSGLALVILVPAFLIVALLIKLDSKGPVFYKQKRVGKDERDFNLIKFRTMHIGSDKKGLLTVGSKDNRITRVGYILRKYKVDEFPQLLNVISGEMSIVGPRPEVKKYTELYTTPQKKVLSVRPGLTDYASILYINENELLQKVIDPEKLYIEEIMPVKIKLNLKYIADQSFLVDMTIIIKTLLAIFNRNK